MKRSGRAGSILLGVVLAAVLVPFAVLVVTALYPADTLVPGLLPPWPPRFDNFAAAWKQAGFGSLLASSAIIAVVVVPVTAVLASLAGYAFATMRVPFGRLIYTLFLAGLTLPLVAIVIPLYFGFRDLGLLNSYWSVILPLSAAFLPFGVVWMRSYFAALPHELLDAAAVDGAGRLRMLLSIMLPLARPALVTLMLLDFMWAWNHFLLALILIRDPSRRTAPAGLGAFVGQYGTQIPLLAAGTLMVIAPVVVVYLIFQRQFVAGLTQGALK